jgi:hypothetical protein
MSPTHAYRPCNLSIDLGEIDESFVEIFDSLGSVFGRLVADIAYAAMGKESDVGDGELAKVLAYVVFGEPWWQSAHKNPRRLHCCAHIKVCEEEKKSRWRIQKFTASVLTSGTSANELLGVTCPVRSSGGSSSWQQQKNVNPSPALKYTTKPQPHNSNCKADPEPTVAIPQQSRTHRWNRHHGKREVGHAKAGR